jgi:hypothetical protein
MLLGELLGLGVAICAANPARKLFSRTSAVDLEFMTFDMAPSAVFPNFVGTDCRYGRHDASVLPSVSHRG